MKKLKKLTFWILGISLVLGYIHLLVGRDLMRKLKGGKVIKIAALNKTQEFSFNSNDYSDFNTVTRLRPEFFEA